MCYFLVTRKSTEGRPSNGEAFTSIFEMKTIIFFALKMLVQFSILMMCPLIHSFAGE